MRNIDLMEFSAWVIFECLVAGAPLTHGCVQREAAEDENSCPVLEDSEKGEDEERGRS